jgi:hypothetical protein
MRWKRNLKKFRDCKQRFDTLVFARKSESNFVSPLFTYFLFPSSVPLSLIFPPIFFDSDCLFLSFLNLLIYLPSFSNYFIFVNLSSNQIASVEPPETCGYAGHSLVTCVMYCTCLVFCATCFAAVSVVFIPLVFAGRGDFRPSDLER